LKLTTHGNYLAQLTRLWMVNMYFVKETDGLTLIDTGFGGSAKGILEAAAKLGSPIRRITLTHAHVDHAGAVDALHQALPEAELILPERTAGYLGGTVTLLPEEPQAPISGGFVTIEATPDRTLAPGDRLGSLHVIAAPGHSPDQVAFYDERDGTLIAGDAFQTLGGFAVSGVMRWRFPLPAMATWHLPTAVASARALAELEPVRLAVGHGAVLQNPAQMMAKGIAEAESKFDAQAQTAQ
jgi:glyoxylase-like metal-dependent hydrolase (beta-lactamase superfamily II)